MAACIAERVTEAMAIVGGDGGGIHATLRAICRRSRPPAAGGDGCKGPRRAGHRAAGGCRQDEAVPEQPGHARGASSQQWATLDQWIVAKQEYVLEITICSVQNISEWHARELWWSCVHSTDWWDAALLSAYQQLAACCLSSNNCNQMQLSRPGLIRFLVLRCCSSQSNRTSRRRTVRSRRCWSPSTRRRRRRRRA